MIASITDWPVWIRVAIWIILAVPLTAGTLWISWIIRKRIHKAARRVLFAEYERKCLEAEEEAVRARTAAEAAESAAREERERQERFQADQRARAEVEQNRLLAEAERERQRRAAEQWAQTPKLRRCNRDGFVYPHFLIPRCPKCNSVSDQNEIAASPDYAGRKPQGSTSARSLLSDDLTKELDFPGIGNLVLRVLMEAHQQTAPNQDADIVAKYLAKFIAKKFRLAPGRTYSALHSDVHLPGNLRDRWTEDLFPQSTILAYVLGATWTTLPSPDDKLVSYYQLIASRQTKVIEHLGETTQRADRETEMNTVIAARVKEAREKGMSEHEIDIEVEFIRQHYATSGQAGT